MKRQIYLLREQNELIEMQEAYYDSEALLQELLAKYPNLLAGEQMDADNPRRWLLVSREMQVPGEADGAGRWSLDHLFLDQEAVPTLVEVKRSTDTRLRREVVGQMLDYSANAVAYWPMESIRAAFERRCEAEGHDEESVLGEFLGEEEDAGEFWTRVKTNLQAGRVRMVFVADVIPTELQRIVEFLNGQMDPAEVLAVEIKQYVSESMRTLVPRVLGQTATAAGKKSSSPASPRERITREEFLRAFEESRSPEEVELTRRIVELAERMGVGGYFTRNNRGVSYIPQVDCHGRTLNPFLLRSWGFIVLHMAHLRDHEPFNDPTLREELRQKCEGISGWAIRGAGMAGLPRFILTRMAAPADQEKLLSVVKWMIEQIKGTE